MIHPQGLVFDGIRGELSGVPNSKDVFYSPQTVRIVAVDPAGATVSATVTLNVDGQCPLQSFCDSCIDSGCRWVGNKCNQGCPDNAVCTTDLEQCPGRKLGQSCNNRIACIQGLKCDMSVCVTDHVATCAAASTCQECLSTTCNWSNGRCGATCEDGAKCYNFDPTTCPSQSYAAAIFSGIGGVNGMVLFEQPSASASVTVKLNLRYSTDLRFNIGNHWRVHENKVVGSSCGSAGSIFNPTGVDVLADKYSLECKRDHSKCAVGDLATIFGPVDIPSPTRTFMGNYISLYGRYSIVGRSIVIDDPTDNSSDRLACATIRLLDGTAPLIFSEIPDYHVFNDRFTSLDLGSHFFDPRGGKLNYTIFNLPSDSRLKFDTVNGLLEGIPGASDNDLGLIIIATNEKGQSISQNFKFFSDGQCIHERDCDAGYCRNGRCESFRQKGQACNHYMPCEYPFSCNVESNGKGECAILECNAATCSGYCQNSACMPFRWVGETCNRVERCHPVPALLTALVISFVQFQRLFQSFLWL